VCLEALGVSVYFVCLEVNCPYWFPVQKLVYSFFCTFYILLGLIFIWLCCWTALKRYTLYVLLLLWEWKNWNTLQSANHITFIINLHVITFPQLCNPSITSSPCQHYDVIICSIPLQHGGRGTVWQDSEEKAWLYWKR